MVKTLIESCKGFDGTVKLNLPRNGGITVQLWTCACNKCLITVLNWREQILAASFLHETLPLIGSLYSEAASSL